MSNNNISSLEWLIEKYTIVCGLGSKELMKEHIARAKAMHKKQSFKTFKAGQDSMEEGGKGFDQWYQETYGGEQ